ncbi:hypothetical protein ACFLT2_01565 [Acidobacteriota bacterium]
MRLEKMKYLKNSKVIFLLCMLVLCACSGGRHWKVRVEMPRAISFELERFQELVITDFLIKSERKDMDINKEMVEYFSFEFGQNIAAPVSTKEINFADEDIFEDEIFWKDLPTELEEAIILTGSVEYKSEIRKALVDEEKRQFEDPFPQQSGLEERKFYTLLFDLYMIDAKTGKILYTRNFKQTKHYINPNQTAYFAFFDLMLLVKNKLFQAFLGEELLQERYLLSK